MTVNSHTYIPGIGLPLGPPLGLSEAPASSQVRGSAVELGGTNTPGATSPGALLKAGQLSSSSRVRRRVTRERLGRIVEEMADRDHRVLDLVAAHRFMTTIQLQRLVFTDHESVASASRTTRRVLSRLERWGLLRMLHRRVGGVRAGSSARIWQLAPAGARIVAADGVTYRVSDPSVRFLKHCLAVADVHVLLKAHERIETIEAVTVQVEPDCWRRYTGLGGEPRWLQPDLAATILTADYEDRWFIEVDLGTESLPTLLKKCRQYEAYRSSGNEQTAHGSFPLVMWLFSDNVRAKKLRDAVAHTPSLTPPLYRFATPDTVATVLSGGAT